MPCILFEELLILSPILSLVFFKKSADIFLGMTVKARRRLLFCLGISKPLSMRTGLALPYVLGIDVISFSITMSLFFFFLSHFSTKK